MMYALLVLDGILFMSASFSEQVIPQWIISGEMRIQNIPKRSSSSSGFASLRKKKVWKRENYIVSNMYEREGKKHVYLNTFNISSFQRAIVNRIQCKIFQNASTETGEVSWTLELEFGLFDETEYDQSLRHKITRIFPHNKDRLRNRRSKLKKYISDAETALLNEQDEQMKRQIEAYSLNCAKELQFIDETKSLFEQEVFERTGRKRLTGELKEMYGYYPNVKTVLGSREASVPCMKAWLMMDDGQHNKGILVLYIGSERFELVIKPLDEVVECEGTEKRMSHKIAHGFYHRDGIDESIGQGWAGYRVKNS